MAEYVFTNRASGNLAVDTPGASATLTLVSGQGASFPSPSGGDIATLVIEDRTTGQFEIVYCTARIADVLNVTRAQEGTSALDFLAGATVSNRITAGTMHAIQDIVGNVSGYTQIQADALFVFKAGDAMTGHLSQALSPTLAAHLTRKDYVDAADALALLKSGGAMTGLLTLSGDPGAALGAATKQYVDNAVTAAGGFVDAPSNGSSYVRKNAGWTALSIAEVPSLSATLASKSNTGHVHDIGDVNGLQTALDGKALLAHTHVIADVTGLSAALAGKANTVHPHVIADVTSLQATLDDKASRTTDNLWVQAQTVINTAPNWAFWDTDGVVNARRVQLILDNSLLNARVLNDGGGIVQRVLYGFNVNNGDSNFYGNTHSFGSKAVAANCNIDLNSSGLNFTYDVRLVSVGGSVSAGRGALAIYGAGGTEIVDGVFTSSVRGVFRGTTGGASIGTALVSGVFGSLEVKNDSGGGAAMMAFHRNGLFFAYFGLDNDNEWRVGGGSYGAASYKVWTQANAPDVDVRLRYKGTYVAGASYAKGDAVSWVTATVNGFYFSLFNNNLGHTPDTNPAWWQLMIGVTIAASGGGGGSDPGGGA